MSFCQWFTEWHTQKPSFKRENYKTHTLLQLLSDLLFYDTNTRMKNYEKCMNKVMKKKVYVNDCLFLFIWPIELNFLWGNFSVRFLLH